MLSAFARLNGGSLPLLLLSETSVVEGGAQLCDARPPPRQSVACFFHEHAEFAGFPSVRPTVVVALLGVELASQSVPLPLHVRFRKEKSFKRTGEE